MGLIQSIKAVFKKKESLPNPVKLFINAKDYVIVLPDDEFFFYLLLEPLLNVERALKDRGKRVMFLVNGDITSSPELFGDNVMRVNYKDKSNTSIIKSELSSDYRGACYITCNFPDNILNNQFKDIVKPSVSVSIGFVSYEFNICLAYNGHYEDFVKALYGFFCVRRRTLSRLFKARKSVGKGVGINRDLYGKYRGEKIMKPVIIDNNFSISTPELAKLINKNEYIVSYRDRIAAIGYLLKKKVICVTDDMNMLPNGMDYCHGIGGEIDYFIE